MLWASESDGTAPRPSRSFDPERQLTENRAQKCRALLQRLDQGDAQIGPQERERQPGRSRA